MGSYDDFKTRKLKDRIAGRWFVEKRTPGNVRFETIGRSIALSLRVLLRKNIGTESFTIWNVLWAFLWVRLCLVINVHEPESKEGFNQLFNPLIFDDFGTGFLNIFSLFFLLAVLWYYIRSEVPTKNRPYTDVISRGRSVPLNPVINPTRWYRRKGIVQAIVAPSLGLLLGFGLFHLPDFLGVGCYFFISSIALGFDEYNYHRAKFRLNNIMKAKGLRAIRNKDDYNFDDFDEFD